MEDAALAAGVTTEASLDVLGLMDPLGWKTGTPSQNPSTTPADGYQPDHNHWPSSNPEISANQQNYCVRDQAPPGNGYQNAGN